MSIIRPMEERDREAVMEMMRVFYSSPAVLTNGSEEIFRADIDACVGDNPYLEGFVACEDGEIIGYTMLAKSFSTEFGMPCIWIEDIYIKEEFRGLGLGSSFFKFIEEKYPSHLMRLEVESDNEKAMSVYRKNGLEIMPYTEMKKEIIG